MKKYGSYTDADLNEWERLPLHIKVLTQSGMAAWLMRRDERMLTRIIEKIEAEFNKSTDEENYQAGLYFAIDVIRKYICVKEVSE